MKSPHPRSVCLSAAAMLAAATSLAQVPSPHPTQTPPRQTAPQPAQPRPAQQNQQPSGRVVFSRSTDENGDNTTQTGPAAPPVAPQIVNAPIATDAERDALTYSALDMDVHLRTAGQHIAVRALIAVRNDGKTPLAHIPLQISSSLNWERVRIAARDTAFSQATLNSDTDHTGQLHEAAVPLDQPLAPGQTLQLDVTYSGQIPQSAQRLLALGTPDDAALHSDWDEIGVPFTGLRGFGNVVWYPVSSVPVILGDGARLFDEMGEQKLRTASAKFRLRLTVEFPHGRPPTVALISGHPVPLAVTEVDSVGEEIDGVATASLDAPALGFTAPSLFLAARAAHAAANSTLWTLPIDEPAVESWSASAARVDPFLESWLGKRPRAQLTVLDLPDPDDAPFESGDLLAVSIREAPPQQLDGVLVHALAHALMHAAKPPPAWLDEGVAFFMSTLWVEKQHDRTQALEVLEAARPALALAEPSSPGVSAGQPLAQAISPVYYRTKAAYVLWMLRDLVGDAALSAALRAYNPPAETEKKAAVPPESGAAASQSLQKLLEQASARKDLSWFFADWIDADKGLPDLAIDSVFPSAAQAGNWLVAVNISNYGYASAEVPVTVRSDTNSVTERVLVPGRGKAVQRILILGRPNQVQLNDGTVPETQAGIHIAKLDDSSDNPSAPVPQPLSPLAP